MSPLPVFQTFDWSFATGTAKAIFEWHDCRLYQDHNYTWSRSCIKTSLPQATVFSLGPVNWDVVYATVLS